MTGKLRVGIAGFGVVGKRRRTFIDAHPALAQKIRLGAAQDVAWALANSPAFLFNR